MQIVDLKTFVIGNPWKNWVLVKIETDEGIYGWGDATQGLATQPVVGAVQELKRFCVGRSPLRIEKLWEEMHKGLYLTANGTLLSAMAAVETACWDILGRALKVPLHQLLGGKVNDRIRCYANGWYKGSREPGVYAERALEVVGLGYRALKMDPFGANYRVLEPSERRLSLDIVKAVREAVGDDVDIIIEVHDRLSVSEAIQVCRRLEEFNPLWIEAPVWSVDVGALVAVAGATDLRIGCGERFTTLREFADLLSCGRFDLLLPEYVELGGLHRLRQVAALAEAYQAMLAPHNARCMLSTAVNVQFDAATRNVFIQETFDDFHVPWARDLFEGLPKIVDGCFEVPDAPGLGVEVNEELVAKYPYSNRNFMNLFKDGWENRF
ncbi:MAG: mandelate racemase/muconate lactonizing enzyme family protein [Nitrospiraceae bacterium]|nr:mandelate racemase/muconate lactonizing enzyme family protein [Nitrospiraceae bacterium]